MRLTADLPPSMVALATSPAFLVSLSSSLISVSILLRVLNRAPEKEVVPGFAHPLDPVGGVLIKRLVAAGMTMIAQMKESRKSKAPRNELEAFHKPEDHAFFNESYYFNGTLIFLDMHIYAPLANKNNNIQAATFPLETESSLAFLDDLTRVAGATCFSCSI